MIFNLFPQAETEKTPKGPGILAKLIAPFNKKRGPRSPKKGKEAEASLSFRSRIATDPCSRLLSLRRLPNPRRLLLLQRWQLRLLKRQ